MAFSTSAGLAVGSSHLQHGVDGLQRLRRACSGQLAVDIGSPVNLLDQRVGSLRELLGCIIDLVSIGRCCTKHCHCSSSCTHLCGTACSRHEGTLQLAERCNCRCGNEHLACLGHSS